jgi:hypothetical protein
LELHSITGDEKYEKAAVANLDWVIQRQQKNGWFENANFKPHELPNTHGIAYTIRGLLESYFITKKEKYFDASLKAAEKLLRKFEIRKYLYTFWDSRWKNHGKYFKNMKGKYMCLTGNIQLALVWMKIYRENNDSRFVNSAFKMVDLVKALQNMISIIPGIKGAIKGTFPVNGSYSWLKYPNWAAKFFADALMLKINLKI